MEPNEPKVRTNVKELANGELRFEATTRGDTPEESVTLLKNTYAQLEAWRNERKV